MESIQEARTVEEHESGEEGVGDGLGRDEVGNRRRAVLDVS